MDYIVDISVVLGYLLGGVLILFWKERFKGRRFTTFLGWSFGMMVLYLLYLEMLSRSPVILLPALFIMLFCLMYFREKRRMINGLLFNLAFVSLGIYMAALMIATENVLLGGLLIFVFLAFLLLIGFGVYALIILLYWNGLVVLRRESHSIANLLTLLLALFLTAVLVADSLIASFLPQWVAMLFAILPTCMIYFAVVFYNFLTISILYQFNHPKLQQDYVIVLGAGLIDGERVTPLLARRIDKAMDFYTKQKEANGKAAKLLMSGGQGADEKVPEAIAMKNYALEQGIPETDILVETDSKTTLENMRFSKKIIESISGTQYRAIFSSNNYHIFRAGMFAREAGLKADGIGAKTAFYFLPNAFLREFVAIVMIHKYRHLAICGLITLFLGALALIQLLLF